MTSVERRLRQIASELFLRASNTFRLLSVPVPAADVVGVLDDRYAWAYKTLDQTDIGTAYADVNELLIPVAANTAYGFHFKLICDADATTTGIDVAVNGPNSPTLINYLQTYWTSATASTQRGATSYDANTASTASNGTAPRIFVVEGILINGANAGNLAARAKREAVGAGPHVRAGSYGQLWKLSA